MQRGLPYFAVGIGLVLLGLAFSGVQEFAAAVFVTGMVAFLMGGYAWFKPYFTKDRYDLNQLKVIHDALELKVDAHAPETDAVNCPHCGNVYSQLFPVCPNCRRTP